MMISGLPSDLHLAVRQKCVQEDLEVTAENLAQVLRELVPVMSHAQRLVIIEEILLAFDGMGPLATLLLRPNLTDIVVNSCNEVWIDCGLGMHRVDCSWIDEEALRHFAIRLAGLAHRRLDDAVPWVDARLPNGIRLHAVIPPLSVNGTKISLRVPALETMTLDHLMQLGSFSATGAVLLKHIVQAGVSFVVCGGTGSGKTTVLNAMLAHVPTDKRMLVIEDSTELAIKHPHVVTLTSRHANVEGIGEVTMRTLVRQALRMRPDRLIVGEVRGAEVADLLTAFNTGHEGGAVTIHSNSAQTVPARFEALGLMAGLPRESIHTQLVGGVQVVIELGRLPTGQRVARSINVLQLDASGKATVIPAIDLCTDARSLPGYDILQSLLEPN
jgi:pilus assembly protein CpaF